MGPGMTSRLHRARSAARVRRVKLLFIGDIVGKPGRQAVRGLVPWLRARHGLDLVIANGENAVGGNGINREKAGEIFDYMCQKCTQIVLFPIICAFDYMCQLLTTAAHFRLYVSHI